MERPSSARFKWLKPRSAREREERMEEEAEAVVVAVVVVLVVEVAVLLRVGKGGGSSPLGEGFCSFFVVSLLVVVAEVEEEEEEEEEAEEAETVRRRWAWWRTAPFPLRYRTIVVVGDDSYLLLFKKVCVVDLTRSHTPEEGKIVLVLLSLDVPTHEIPSLLLT